MKKTLSTILLIISLCGYSQCPVKGDNNKTKFQHLDSLKNRVNVGKSDLKVTLEMILKTGDDTKRFTDKQYVKLTGYVILVKDGGAETCNCHSKNKVDLDVHIEIAINPDGDAKHAMIVEINRYTKLKNKSYTVSELKKLIGKKVNVEGWLFFDEEHKQNAVNTSPNGTTLWRATCWEVHPVINITQTK